MSSLLPLSSFSAGGRHLAHRVATLPTDHAPFLLESRAFSFSISPFFAHNAPLSSSAPHGTCCGGETAAAIRGLSDMAQELNTAAAKFKT